MSERGVRWPLWDDAGPLGDGPPEVPAAVAEQMRAWAETFNRHYDAETGTWSSPEIAAQHKALGLRLYRELRATLPGVDISYEPWEHEPREDEGVNPGGEG